MDQFTFDTFVTNDENREAADLCRMVANLRPIAARPLLILGKSGAGKTHLLCAIVNHIKTHHARTALAYVTARNFPLAVQNLADDPSPVTRAPSGVLLVDQLEKWTPGMLGVLDRIAPLFLGQGRFFIMASQVDPGGLPDLPGDLRGLIVSGGITRLEKPAPQPVVNPSAQRILELESENTCLRQELNEARVQAAKLEHAAGDLARLQEQMVKVETDRQQLELAQAAASETLGEQRVLKQEVRSLQRALEETRKQRDAFQADSSALAAATAELARLRKQIAAAQPAADLSPAAGLPLNQPQEEPGRHDPDTYADLDRWALKAQTILQQVELNRARFAENAELQLQQVLALRQRVEQLASLGGSLESSEVGEIARKLQDIRDTASQGLPADSETRLQTLYAQLLQAAQAIQELGDRVNDQGGEPGSSQPRPWYADPFPLPTRPAQGPEA